MHVIIIIEKGDLLVNNGANVWLYVIMVTYLNLGAF